MTPVNIAQRWVDGRQVPILQPLTGCEVTMSCGHTGTVAQPLGPSRYIHCPVCGHVGIVTEARVKA